MCEVLLEPRAGDVERAGVEFDAANEVREEVLRDLFTRYPYNTQTAHVLLKATVLNTFYSTLIPVFSARVPTIDDVAVEIACLDIDSEPPYLDRYELERNFRSEREPYLLPR
jgi:hypothetical protein